MKPAVVKAVLDNGIRVVAERIPHLQSLSIGLWVEVGSRDEGPGEHGISHFIEHMFFKGTAKRSAQQIAEEIDHLGGELNAFTARETTTFYLKLLEEHLAPSLALLGDIFHNSTFDPVEIERERQVVLEEIKMVEDDAEDLVHDLHTENVWRRSPLGHPVQGDLRSVEGFTRDQVLGYVARHYHPRRIVISVAGRFSSNRLLGLLNRTFGGYRRESGAPAFPRRTPPELDGRFLLKRKALEQVHFCMGLRGIPLNHAERYVGYALNILLGGSMSSRLFQEVRERRGLVYSIYSSLVGFKDTGLFTIYGATGKENLEKVVQVTARELRRIRRDGVRREELERALNQLKAAIMIGLESTNSRMNRLAKDELYLGRYVSMRETMSEVAKVNRRRLHALCDALLDPKSFSLTILGPVGRAAHRFPDFLNLLRDR